MRLQTACFTGHREIPYAEQKNIQKQTLDAVEDLDISEELVQKLVKQVEQVDLHLSQDT